MKELWECYSNFALRAFDLRGRSTMIEYWAVMPLIWALMILLLMRDFSNIYAALLVRDTPSMNPLVYPSVILFCLTLIPRLSLSLRRLHDHGRSAIWLLVPILMPISTVILFLALTGAMMNSSLTGVSDGPHKLSNILHPFVLYFGAPQLFWSEMYAIADAFYGVGSKAITWLLAEIYAAGGAVDVRRVATSVTNEIATDFGYKVMYYTALVVMPTAPVLTTLVNGFMMFLGSDPKTNRYGRPKLGALQYKKADDAAPNPLAGYAALYETTPEEKAQRAANRAREVESLYQQRVLGQQS